MSCGFGRLRSAYAFCKGRGTAWDKSSPSGDAAMVAGDREGAEYDYDYYYHHYYD